MAGQPAVQEVRHANLPRFVREAKKGITVELTQRDELVAVLTSWQRFKWLVTNHRGLIEVYGDFTNESDLKEYAPDPYKLFAGTCERV